VFEIVVVIEGRAGARPLRRRRTLQELRRVALARLARFARRALGRIAADLRLQLDDVEGDVGLPAPLGGGPRRAPRGGGGARARAPAAPPRPASGSRRRPRTTPCGRSNLRFPWHRPRARCPCCL